MDGDAPTALFLGDLDDPWVSAIAGALPLGASCLHVAGDLPPLASLARVIVVQRSSLGPSDREVFLEWKDRAGIPPKLILCVGPQIRAGDLDRWAGPADVILHEATASETIARHVTAWRRPRHLRPPVTVVGGSFECRRILAATCEAAGERVRIARDWDEAPAGGVAVWDVPVLETSWATRLSLKATDRRIVCMMGFADRDLVTRARRNGASACLDVPYEPADLAFVLNRLAAERPILLPFDPAHASPPRPKGLRVGTRPVFDRVPES